MDHSSVRVYPFPDGEAVYPSYDVTANGVNVPLHMARVSTYPVNTRWPGHQRPKSETELCPFASMAADGAVAFDVTADRDFRAVQVKPLSKGVTAEACGRRVRFTVPGPGFYTLELDGYHNALHIFIDPMTDYGVDPGDPDVLYYGRGVHDVGLIELHSGQTLYLEEGAVVYARIVAKDADHIRILGHGILDGSRNVETILCEVGEQHREEIEKHFAINNAIREHTVQLEYCRDVRIDGITLRDSLVYCIRPICCKDVEIGCVKLIGNWRYNSDGIDMHNCENVHIHDCFLRTFDDSICIKGFDYTQNEADMYHNGVDYSDFRHVLVERCVIWNDWGRALEIGAETRAKEICDITFRDCDLLRTTHIACDVQNVDYADVHHITFDDIRVELDPVSQQPIHIGLNADTYAEDPNSTYMPMLLCSNVTYIEEYSRDREHRGVNRDILYRNIAVTAPKMPLSHFRGWDAEHTSREVTVENLTLNGVRVTDPETARFTTGPDTPMPRLI